MRVVHTEQELHAALRSPDVFVFSGQHTRQSVSLLGWLRSGVSVAWARAARRINVGWRVNAFPLRARQSAGTGAPQTGPFSARRDSSSSVLADGSAGGPPIPASYRDVLDRLTPQPQ